MQKIHNTYWRSRGTAMAFIQITFTVNMPLACSGPSHSQTISKLETTELPQEIVICQILRQRISHGDF